MSAPTHDDEDARRFARAVFRAQLAEAFSRPAPMTWALVAALATLGLGQVSAESWLGDQGVERVLLAGALIPDRLVEGEWWRALTGPMLHKSWSHLLMNLVGLGLIGRQIEAAYGSAGFVVLWLAASLGGVCGTVLAGHAMSVGASGGVFGLVGALLAVGLRLWPRLQRRLRLTLVLLPALLLLVVLGLGELAAQIAAPTLDREAHVAGALGGVLGGLWLPLRLRDGDGAPLVAMPSAGWRRLVQALALVGLLASGLAVGVAARQGFSPPAMAPLPTSWAATPIGPLRLPAGGARGVLRDGACEGGRVSVDWALQHDRTLCMPLPMGGMLLLGRRDRLLTLDAGDAAAMGEALRRGAFVRRQAGVLVHPVGARHLFAVLGADALLPTYGEALAPLLPVAATVAAAAAATTPAPEEGAAPLHGEATATTPMPATAPTGTAP